MFSCEYLPVLHINASNNYDVGLSIGRTFKSLICSYIDSKTGSIIRSFYESPNGKEVYNEALAATKTHYPHIYDEMRGIADGCSLPFEIIFMNNMISDILLTHSSSDLVSPTRKDANKKIAGCTDILVNTEKCRLIAHNEDWEDDADNNSFLVDVDLDKSACRKSVGDPAEQVNVGFGKVLSVRNERYLAFLFPGNLVGNAFFLNQKFAFTINSLLPAVLNKGTVPVDILLRALVGCETIEECVKVMKNEPTGCSNGININIASRETKDMWTLEVYPDNGKTVVSLKALPFMKNDEKPEHFVHANHYKHIRNAKELPLTKGSIAREFTASSMPTPTCIRDVCNILGDLSGDVEPIYITPGNSLFDEHVKTLATAVFDMNESKLHIFLKNPKEAEKPTLTLPFV